MSYQINELEKRYINDAKFYALCNMIYAAVKHDGFTPGEIREAVFLAHYRFEMENPNLSAQRINNRISAVYDSELLSTMRSIKNQNPERPSCLHPETKITYSGERRCVVCVSRIL